MSDVLPGFRYVVVKKLGWGHFSTVWMVKDRKSLSANGANHFYALKVQKSAEHYTEAAMDEVELLDCISAERKKCEAEMRTVQDRSEAVRNVEHSRFIATLHDSFFHAGPHGRHMCMVFSMLGVNLLSVIKAHNYRGIPMEVVKTMIRGVCMGLDFLHRKCQIIHTDLKPENVLLQFPHQIEPDDELAIGQASIEIERNSDQGQRRTSLEQSINDIQRTLGDPELPQADKKKLKKKLKKKKQKERKRNTVNKNADSSDEEDIIDDNDENDIIDDVNESSGILGEYEIGKILSKATSMITGNRSDALPADVHGRVKRRLGHSHFVMANFGSQVEANSKLTEIVKDSVAISRALQGDTEACFGANDEVDVANILILMRSFVPEEELADTLTAVLDGVPWETKNGGREWCCKLTLPASKLPQFARPEDGSCYSTCFVLSQRTRKDVNEAEKDAYVDLATLVSENIADEGQSENAMSEIPPIETTSPRPNRSPPASIFSLKIPVSATYVVLSFLECRLPGVVFMNYKREEGRPQLDSIVFGPFWKDICDHPLSMRIKDTSNDSSCSLASSVFGFDLRLVKDFGARTEVNEHSATSFALTAVNNEKVNMWWEARLPIQLRIKSFTGVDSSPDIMNFLSHEEERTSRKATIENDKGFKEGGKKPSSSDTPTAPSSRDTSASSAARIPNQQVNLKDVEMLKKCRAVTVDLGNACWTYRHFSEDIQTRQYRAPEVLIGSKYDTSADIWSLGCMTFELLTGDLLFDPRAGEDYDRDEDHLAMFQELLGKMPKKIALEGKYAKNFFDKKGNLKHIKQLKFWPVQEVLVEKYHFSRQDAQDIADFMLPLLDFDPKTRFTALEALESDWLKI